MTKTNYTRHETAGDRYNMRASAGAAIVDDKNDIISISEQPSPKRILILGALAVLAAMPLVWFSVDADAGDTLLKLTSPSAQTKAVKR